MSAYQRFINQYTQNKGLLAGQNLQWLSVMRESAFEDFSEQGLPDGSDENWKYTPLTQLLDNDYELAQQPATAITALPSAIKHSSCNEHCLVFINGYYQAQLSNIGLLPDGILLTSLTQALRDYPQLVAAELGKTARNKHHPFTALNSAMLCDGVFLWALENTHVEHPIHCLFISSPSEQAVISHPRLLLTLKNNAQLTLIEHYMDLSSLNLETKQTKPSHNLSNSVTEVRLSPQARMNHYKLQYESLDSAHISAIYVEQQQESIFTSHNYSLGAALARHDIAIKMSEPQAQCCLNGAYLVDGHQHVDCHTHITHLSPDCHSDQLYKGIVQGNARAVFNGAVVIAPGAQHSKAKQLNKNLLLSSKGEVNSKPELQIYTDDVLCSHGATVGQLDSQVLFYLQSRGLSQQEAQAWLVYAFISELLKRIENPALRKFIQQPVITHLEQLVGDGSNLLQLLPTESRELLCR